MVVTTQHKQTKHEKESIQEMVFSVPMQLKSVSHASKITQGRAEILICCIYKLISSNQVSYSRNLLSLGNLVTSNAYKGSD